MTDNARRFSAVRMALVKNYPAAGSPRLARHLTTLSALVAGIVAAGSTHLPKIAQKVPDQTKADSRVKRFSRLLNNERTRFETYFLPFAREVACCLAQNRPLLVVFDGSSLGRGSATLMASLVYRRRALPLAWIVKRGKKGHFSWQDHLDLFDRLRQVIPERARVIFLGDGEFDSVELQRALDQAGYDYVCRTSSSILVQDGYTECAIGELMPFDQQRYASLPGASITKAAYGPVHVVVWHEKRHQNPIFLVTNLELAEEALYWYKRRFRIETLFSDHKSRGFHMHKSHISDPERLSRLLIAAALAYLWMIYLGVEALKRGFYKQFHRSDRVDLSLFQLGLRLLEYFLNENKRILVAFTLSPPIQTVR